MMNRIILILIVAFSFTRCIDPINLLTSENAKTMLVIDAKISKYKDNGKISVDLIQSSLDTRRSFGFIADEVAVLNGAGNKLILNRTEIGRYSANETSLFKFTYGEKYKVRVAITGGDTYESAFSELNQAPVISTAGFKYSGIAKDKTTNLVVSINTTISSNLKNKILKWDVIKTYQITEQPFGGPPGKICYVTTKEDIREVRTLDGRKIENNKPFDFIITEKLVNHEYAEGTYFTIVQEAIDVNTQNYFIAYNNLVQREGNIFETPPGPLPTNFKCITDTTKLVTGYFYASQQDSARIFISPSAVGAPERLCPKPPNEASDCPFYQCCNCINVKGSSRVKPPFWR